MFSRNHFYIDPSLQTHIGSAKIAFLGTGLASTLAEIMVRTGFTNFFLAMVIVSRFLILIAKILPILIWEKTKHLFSKITINIQA